MPDRDIPYPQPERLLSWLMRARARLRLARALRDGSWAASLLLGLFVAYRLLRILVEPPAVVAALVPLLLLCAIAVIVLLGWRLSRPYRLSQAAGVVDRRAALKDELKSAYWFAGDPAATPATEKALQRAVRTVEQLDPRALFPLAVPGALAIALGLAATATALAWLSPRTSKDPQAREGTGSAQIRPIAPGGGRGARTPGEAAVAARRSEDRAVRQAADAQSWSRLQEVARSVDGAAGEALRQAIAARDAQRAIQALEAAAKGEAAGQPSGSAVRPPARQVSEEFARSIIERLQSLLNPDAAQETDAGQGPMQSAAQSAASIARRGEAPPDMPQGGDPGQHTLREDALNMQLRSIARTSTGDRQAVAGRGEGWQEGGRTNASTGAMGQRVGVSGAGAGEDNAAQGNPGGDAPSDPVLGKPTARLAAQLQPGGAPRGEEPDADSAAQSLYVATRAQASNLAYRAQAGVPSSSSEAAMEHDRTPLSYRAAVKSYFLNQHGKER